MVQTKGNVRIAIGNALREHWNSGNTDGYQLDDDIGLILGYYDEDRPMPQMALTHVSSTPQGRNGVVAWKADGSGNIQQFLGRIDINVHTGTVDDVPEPPGILAENIGDEAREIIQYINGLNDPETGEPLCSEVWAASEPVVRTDTQGSMGEYRAIVEVQYLRTRQPPER